MSELNSKIIVDDEIRDVAPAVVQAEAERLHALHNPPVPPRVPWIEPDDE